MQEVSMCIVLLPPFMENHTPQEKEWLQKCLPLKVCCNLSPFNFLLVLFKVPR